MLNKKLRVAIVGLRFGGAFPPIYLEHPDIEYIGICETDEKLLHEYGDQYNISRRHSNIEEVLKSDQYDAVHLVTPIPSHGKLSVDVLDAGKHCACTVPMAITLDDIKAIVEAEKRSKKNYMMMETAVYTYHCLYARELIEKGEIGRIQFLRGAHYQDMEKWPSYWLGLPPMYYSTHAISPLLALSDTRATKVHCFGSGVMRKELQEQYGNPYPVETAIYQLEKDNLAAEVTRTLFHTARGYMENFNIYGEKGSFEWHMENEMPILFKAAGIETVDERHSISNERVTPPNYSYLLPKEIAHFCEHQIIPDPKNIHQSVMQGAGHHGSHPHMVHEFVRSIIEERKPWIDAVKAANWTAAGICAHESAMNGGVEVVIPNFEE